MISLLLLLFLVIVMIVFNLSRTSFSSVLLDLKVESVVHLLLTITFTSLVLCFGSRLINDSTGGFTDFNI